MVKAICFGVLSGIAGFFAAIFNPGFGAVASISIIGIGIISSLEKKGD